MSKKWYDRARSVMPGGVSSPVRAFKAVGRLPLFIERAEGVWMYDVDGNRYIDFILSWGPLILGHNHPDVLKAVHDACERGSSFGMSSKPEVLLAEKIVSAFPCIDKVRFVNSGTEATMSALRLARAVTGRNKVIKFDGCYHGHGDAFLVKAGSGGLTFGTPSSPGIPEPVTQSTISLPYNNIEAVRSAFEEWGEDIACVIVEPIAGNMGVIPPVEGFLEGLRTLTKEYGALLIFDEVITGFRVEFGGMSTRTGIEPDMITLGKIIGGGFPVGAYGGRAELMDKIAPEGPVYQAGTLSGNPVAMTAGFTTLELLEQLQPYPKFEEQIDSFTRKLKELFERKGVPVSFGIAPGFFSFFLREEAPVNLDDVLESDTELFSRLFQNLLNEGVLIAPSAFEASFLSVRHDDAILEQALEAYERALAKL